METWGTISVGQMDEVGENGISDNDIEKMICPIVIPQNIIMRSSVIIININIHGQLFKSISKLCSTFATIGNGINGL